MNYPSTGKIRRQRGSQEEQPEEGKIKENSFANDVNPLEEAGLGLETEPPRRFKYANEPFDPDTFNSKNDDSISNHLQSQLSEFFYDQKSSLCSPLQRIFLR